MYNDEELKTYVQILLNKASNDLNFDEYIKKSTVSSKTNFSKRETSGTSTKRKAPAPKEVEKNEYNKVPDETLMGFFLPPDDDKFNSCTGDELRSLLKSRGLPSSGTKRLLFDRLIDYLENIDKYKERLAKKSRR